MSRRFSRTALLAAAALPLSGLALLGGGAQASTDTEEPESAEEIVFTVALQQKPDTLNPFTGILAASYEIWGMSYDYLVTLSQDDLAIEGELATEWEQSEDGLTWTFTVRDDAVFSDGEPLTAEDIAFTYNEVIDGGPEAASWGSYLQQVENAEAADDTHLVLHLKKPNATLPYIPIPIVPEHIWGDLDDKEVRAFKNTPPDLVGSGPFRVVEADATLSNVTLEKNPDYWGDVPTIDRVIFRSYKTPDAAAQALKKGEIDFAEDLTGLAVESLEGEPNITTHVGTSPSYDEIAFNAGSVDLETGEPIGNPNPAVLDPAFRYALGFAIDRERIADQVYEGLGTPGDTIVPAGNPWKWDPPEDVAFSYDPDRAAELLDAAGYTMGDDGFRTLPSGEPIGKLRIYARTDSQTSLDTINYFHEWLADVGVDSDVKLASDDRLIDIILDGEFDAFQWGWYVDPDPDSMLRYMTCGERGNWSDSWYCDKQYDDWYTEQSTSTDPEARAEILDNMQEKLFMDAPYLVTVYSATGEAYRSDRFEGFSAQPAGDGVYLLQFGSYNYQHIKPVSEEVATAAAAQEESNRNTFIFVIVGGIALLALIGGGIAFARSRTQLDRA
jgi:peptide/nickel transport system substrate-binding protein